MNSREHTCHDMNPPFPYECAACIEDRITVTLIHSLSGLLAEVEGLPVQPGPEYVAKARNRELAEEALKARYPELLVRGASSQGETGYVLFVERV